MQFKTFLKEKNKILKIQLINFRLIFQAKEPIRLNGLGSSVTIKSTPGFLINYMPVVWVRE
jgi:hypothetical protein